ncbi:hypothetical protein RF679_00350 [Undibacterium cyanobacteriorum]|uniref:Uncharacterized protein n=1 Tax=Undibacterium cyanobacteriorum TaxID=3073561 RepID=A0ABY9RHP2_9BURK|nr:hypothetical protein [Undibacterium sp. 20NA77.5]WMW80744.1 hypothetical protein RF679_00350 [Undibacterium sp. 20NA77.5]
MQKIIIILRWCLVPIAMLGSWYAGLILGMGLYGLFDHFCPSSERVSGMCYASWFPLAEQTSFCVGAGTVALLMVLSASYAAPVRKPFVVWSVFFVGCAAALYFAFAASAWRESLTAIFVGFVSAWILSRRWQAVAPR